MRVTWLEIKNFRSIKHLRIEGLDKPQVVLEGPNDVGKSNILHALDLAFSALPRALREKAGVSTPIPGEPDGTPRWARDTRSLFRFGEEQLSVSLGIRFDVRDSVGDRAIDPSLPLECNLVWSLKGPSTPALSFPPNAPAWTREGPELQSRAWALAPAFRLVLTQRAPQDENFFLQNHITWESQADWTGNNLKRMLFLYKNSPDIEIQERFEQLRAALRDPDLGIGTVNVSVQPNQKLNVRTRHEGLELDIEERGSGVQQLLTLLALALCHRGRILAIEEPEMNLSELNQRRLWKKLREFVGPQGPLNQVFVTSHSRIFEEEAERLIASKDPTEGTQAQWAEPPPPRQAAEEEVLPVTRGGGVTLPPEVLTQLGIKEGKHVYLVPTDHGYQLLGPRGYADLLRKGGSDEGSTG